MKQQKGITLIAIVITIIVLLILAGVVIATLSGNNSAPQKATEAAQKDVIAEAKDEIAMETQKDLLDYYNNTYVEKTEGNATEKANTRGIVETAAGRAIDNVQARNSALLSTSGVDTTEHTITLKTKSYEVTGTIDENGGISWGEIASAGGNGQQGGEGTWTGSVTSAEQTALTNNGMSVIPDAQVPNNLKTSSVKAVLTGNVPVPVDYTYVEGTATTQSTTPTSWGVVIEDGSHNQFVWVPVNAEESLAPSDVFEDITENNKMGKVIQGPQKDVVAEEKKMTEIAYAGNLNGVKLASVNGLEGIKFGPKVADSESESGSGTSSISYTVEYYLLKDTTNSDTSSDSDSDSSSSSGSSSNSEPTTQETWEYDDSESKTLYGSYLQNSDVEKTGYEIVKTEPELPTNISDGETIKVYYKWDDETIAKNTTVGTKTKGGILSGITRVNPTDTSYYREPALVTHDLQEQYYTQAGFTSATQMAQAFKKDYEDMVASIKKYGGFYVGRYELSGSVESPTVQANQNVKNKTNWYNLYKACRGLGKKSTTSTMMWGAQWDLMCLWSEKKGDTISYSQADSSRHMGRVAQAGKNSADKRNNIYDVEGNCKEWTQEADSTSNRANRGGYYSYNYRGNEASYRGNGGPYGTDSIGSHSSRPTLYIK